jgi:hypothetical protein
MVEAKSSRIDCLASYAPRVGWGSRLVKSRAQVVLEPIKARLEIIADSLTLNKEALALVRSAMGTISVLMDGVCRFERSQDQRWFEDQAAMSVHTMVWQVWGRSGLSQGVQRSVQAELDKICLYLNSRGLAPLNMVPGERFDPSLHELESVVAKGKHSNPGHGPCIEEVLEPGYQRINGERLLRKAKVSVTG